MICRHCPVILECGADALDNRVEFGVWGGMTERERQTFVAKLCGYDPARYASERISTMPTHLDAADRRGTGDHGFIRSASLARLFERLLEHLARITLDRPDRGNGLVRFLDTFRLVRTFSTTLVDLALIG